jgi:3-methylcrotonyl-CoA carboxylase alpha subunit
LWHFLHAYDELANAPRQAPAPGLAPALRAGLCDTAVAAARAVGYVGAGTVEFIFDVDSGEFFFMEMYVA